MASASTESLQRMQEAVANDPDIQGGNQTEDKHNKQTSFNWFFSVLFVAYFSSWPYQANTVKKKKDGGIFPRKKMWATNTGAFNKKVKYGNTCINNNFNESRCSQKNGVF